MSSVKFVIKKLFIITQNISKKLYFKMKNYTNSETETNAH